MERGTGEKITRKGGQKERTRPSERKRKLGVVESKTRKGRRETREEISKGKEECWEGNEGKTREMGRGV